MSNTVVVTHRIFAETRGRLAKAGQVVAPDDQRLPDVDLRTALQSADAVMVFMPDRVDAAFLKAAPRLKIIAAALKGYDNIDLDACARHGVRVSIVPDLLTAPTAELAIALTLGLIRHLRAADDYVRGGGFTGWTPRFYGLGLEGATVGVVGFGAVGRAISDRLRGFGCRLVHHEQAATSAPGAASLDELLATSDIVILCLPLTERTLHLFDEACLARMKRGAYLVNPARGSLVDEAAIARALADGRLGGYAADTFEMEDLSRPDRPREVSEQLRRAPNTLFGAHIGSATVEARRAIEFRAADNIIDALAGRRPADLLV